MVNHVTGFSAWLGTLVSCLLICTASVSPIWLSDSVWPRPRTNMEIYHFVVSELVIALLSLKSPSASGQTGRVGEGWVTMSAQIMSIIVQPSITPSWSWPQGQSHGIRCLSQMDQAKSHSMKRLSCSQWIEFLILTVANKEMLLLIGMLQYSYQF